MRFINIKFIIILIFTLYSCEDILFIDRENTIYFQNNTEHFIDTYWATGDDVINTTAYPDTSIPKEYEKYMYEDLGYHKPGKKSKAIAISKSIKGFIEGLPLDTISVFIFHTDTLKKYSWEEVCTGYKILKRYDLSYEDLKEMDFEVVYP